MSPAAFTIDCTGDVLAGDTIRFVEAVFSGGPFGRCRSKAKCVAERTVSTLLERDGYGHPKQQHRTEHHPGKSTRAIPLFPELRPYLRESFELAPSGADYGVDERYQ